MAVGGIFNFFGGWRPVPAFRNSPFRRYLSNGPYPVPQFALQPPFRPIFRIFNFGKLRYYYSNNRRYDPLRFSGFPSFGDFRAPGPLRADSSEKFSTERPVFVASPDRRVPKTWYGRFFCSTFGEFQGAVFPVPGY